MSPRGCADQYQGSPDEHVRLSRARLRGGIPGVSQWRSSPSAGTQYCSFGETPRLGPQYINGIRTPAECACEAACLAPRSGSKGVDCFRTDGEKRVRALRKQGEILSNATTFRFDASDLMPGAIGAGAFWSEMTAFANGQDAKTTADNIQAAWDAIK